MLTQAVWIEPHEPTIPPAGQRPAYQLRTELSLPAAPSTATVQATAHGIYELFVNGIRVGDQELTPGFTAYRKRLQVQQYDVTDLLQVGANSVELLISDGWFRGRHGFLRRPDGFGPRVAGLLELAADDLIVATGPDWRSRVSRITAADLMDGQHEDLRLPAPGTIPLSAHGWHPVHVGTDGLYDDRTRLIEPIAPPVRRIEELPPIAVTSPAPATWVIDFGQNLNGWIRLTAPPDISLTLVHGERLDDTGLVTTDHLRAFDFTTHQPLPAGQVDAIVTGSDVFEPRHTTHGFRYVQVSGCSAPPSATAIVVHTDLRRTGQFACSDDALNALHEAAVWSLRGNVCDIPTDCPQRERSGFTGDWQVYVATAALTHDVSAFSAKWLQDLAADQWPDGRVPTVTPNPAGAGPSGSLLLDAMEGSAGWGDAAVFVPWEVWRAYGDLTVLERQYDSMVRWVDYAVSRTQDLIWNTGGHFGEWLEPGEIPRPDPTADHGIVATAYLARSAHLLSRIAALLDRRTDTDRYAVLAAAVRSAWQREYLLPDATIATPTQANHVRALAFNLIPDDLRQPIADQLAALVATADHHVGTGFLSTGLLLPTLADNGHLETAYRVLQSTGNPSWLGMLERGATTIWEHWDGATGSLNHYSKGAAISFLYTHIAGIRLPDEPTAGEAGYRHVLIQPQPGGGLQEARAEVTSAHGVVRSHWRLIDGELHLTVDIPPGVLAEARMPDGRVRQLSAGRTELANGRQSDSPPHA